MTDADASLRDASVESLFERSGALLDGHFLLKSGRHAGRYLEKFLVLQHPSIGVELCRRFAAVLAPLAPTLVVGPTTGGVLLSFETAGRIHHVSNVPALGPTVVTVRHSGWQRLPGVTVHQLDDLRPDHVTEVDGLPVTTLERTIVDLAAVWRRGRVRMAVEDAVAAKRTTDAAIGACLRSVARRGKPGVRLLAGVLDDRGPGKAVPTSGPPAPRARGRSAGGDAARAPRGLRREGGAARRRRLTRARRDRTRQVVTISSSSGLVTFSSRMPGCCPRRSCSTSTAWCSTPRPRST